MSLGTLTNNILATQYAITDTITEPTTSLFDRSASPSVALSQDRGRQTLHGGDHGATATVDPLSVTAATPLSLEQLQDQRASALDEEEWEIVRIIGKRGMRRGYEYKVHQTQSLCDRSDCPHSIYRGYWRCCRCRQGSNRSGNCIFTVTGSDIYGHKCCWSCSHYQ